MNELENHVKELIRKNPNHKDQVIDLWDLFVMECEDEAASRSNEWDHFVSDLEELSGLFIPSSFPRSI